MALTTETKVFPLPSAVQHMRRPSLAGVLILSAFLGVGLLVMPLVLAAGVWDFLAISRLLDPLIDGGFIQYHDMNYGFVEGLPSPEYYYMSQDPIDWRLLIIAAALFFIYPALKAIQFSIIAREYGSPATPGDNVRAYLYGDGL